MKVNNKPHVQGYHGKTPDFHKPSNCHGGPGGGDHGSGKMSQFHGSHPSFTGTGGPKPDHKPDPMHYNM